MPAFCGVTTRRYGDAPALCRWRWLEAQDEEGKCSPFFIAGFAWPLPIGRALGTSILFGLVWTPGEFQNGIMLNPASHF